GNTVAFGAGSTGTLTLNGYRHTVTNLTTDPLEVGTPVVENANASAVTLTVNSLVSSTYAGALADGPGGGGALSLIKAGAGTLKLSGADTFTGGTTVIGGTLNTVAPG